MKKRWKQREQAGAQRLARAMDYPPDAVADVPCVHITGLGDVLVEGCRGILACTADKLVFDMGAYTASVVGRALLIRELTKDGALSVEGRVAGVAFDGKEVR